LSKVFALHELPIAKDDDAIHGVHDLFEYPDAETAMWRDRYTAGLPGTRPARRRVPKRR